MLKVGITGGIGSGKSTVCQVFETLGIPVFYADAAAKYLMLNDEKLKHQIIDLLGEKVYENGGLNRILIASLIFNDKEKLAKLNALTHPAVKTYGDAWMTQQIAPYCIKEAALFFETGSHKSMDIMIGVSAPLNLRLQRTMQRDKITQEQVLERISQQMNEGEKMNRCDYLVVNDDQTSIIEQVCNLHDTLLQKAKL